MRPSLLGVWGRRSTLEEPKGPPPIHRNKGGEEQPHSAYPELWNVNGVEIDVHAKYVVGTQLWYVQSCLQERINQKTLKDYNAAPINDRARKSIRLVNVEPDSAREEERMHDRIKSSALFKMPALFGERERSVDFNAKEIQLLDKFGFKTFDRTVGGVIQGKNVLLESTQFSKGKVSNIIK